MNIYLTVFLTSPYSNIKKMPKILKIVTHPDPFLRQRAVEIDPKAIAQGRYAELVSDMSETMLKKDGVGLAAPQVGHSIRLIVINTDDGPAAFFNPRILKNSWLKSWAEEGCLSVPETFGEVERFRRTSVEYIDHHGRSKQIEAEMFLARVFQHEIDHLDGVLFIDKARNIKKLAS